MSDILRTITDRDIRHENLAAELTRAVYPLMLRRGLRESWIKVELGLWQALTVTIKEWCRQRKPAAPSQEYEAWRKAFLLAATETAFHIAARHGIARSQLELKLGLLRAFRQVIARGGSREPDARGREARVG